MATNKATEISEISEPFYKNLAASYVSEPQNNKLCGLCEFKSKVKPENAEEPASPKIEKKEDKAGPDRWGTLYDCRELHTFCQRKPPHSYHESCLRCFVVNNKAQFRTEPGCPDCANLIEVGMVAKSRDALVTGGKKRNREKNMYSCWVHVIQATGLKRVDGDKYVNPRVIMKCFGATKETKVGDFGRTYSCVWDTPFSFQKKMDIEELSKEMIMFRIESRGLFGLFNDIIGEVRINAQQVNELKDHEFYQIWTPILHVSGQTKTKGQVGVQGLLQLSVCVLSDKDMKENPQYPLHIYDLEVQMWEELQDKKEVVDFSMNGKYLQNKIDEKKKTDVALFTDSWDIIHIRVYRGEDLPAESNSFVELRFAGLGEKVFKSESRSGIQAAWNHEFTIPIPSGGPVFTDKLQIFVMNKSLLGSKEIAGCFFSLREIIAKGGCAPFWKNIYEDADGEAPFFRGRILVEFTVEKEIKNAVMSDNPCPGLDPHRFPPRGSYRLDVEVHEASHLLEDYPEYQVDISFGHPLTGPKATSERRKGGRCWLTFDHCVADKKEKSLMRFSEKRSCIVHELPLPPPEKKVETKEEDAIKDAEEWHSAPKTHSWQGTFDKNPVQFSEQTLTSDYRSMMPDIIVYVSKKGDMDKCVGYLRIPVNGVKRKTENWEHGEDLTVFPGLWLGDSKARCFVLKELKELREKIKGYLLLKISLSPVSISEGALAPIEPVVTKLPPIQRTPYHGFVVIYQAKDLASVEESGLSNPYVGVQLMNATAESRVKEQTCYPLWFQTLGLGIVSLPADLDSAPTLNVTVMHAKNKERSGWGNPNVFMGKAEIEAISAIADASSLQPAWYPLEFEEHRYGEVLLGFYLIPSTGGDVKEPNPNIFTRWETYCVELNSWALRGSLPSQLHQKKKKVSYSVECWGDIRTFTEEEARSSTIELKIKKPDNPVFYSSLNVRVWEGEARSKSLVAVTSIPVEDLTGDKLNWFRLLDILLRDPLQLARKAFRKWAKKIKHLRCGKDCTRPMPPRTISTVSVSREDSFLPEIGDSDLRMSIQGNRKIRNAPERQDMKAPLLAHDSLDEEHRIDVKEKAPIPDKHMLSPRKLDEDGNEVFDVGQIQEVQCPKLEDKDPGSPYDRHWKIQCDYEMLPLTRNPFQQYDLYHGKDEIHQKYFAKLFVKSKRVVGQLRGNFHAYPMVAKEEKEEGVATANIFDHKRYQRPSLYCVRVYVCRGLNLMAAKPSKSDPYVKLRIGTEEQQSKIKDKTINPKFYEVFDFNNIQLPAQNSLLTLQVINDDSVFEEIIGETTIPLENRIFSFQWQNGRRPLERRGLFKTTKWRIPQGFLEVCLDIMDQAKAGDRPLDYLLAPPVRVPWELRVTLWNTEKVTPKQIYKSGDECCVCDVCLPPNQSDIQLVCGLSGSKEPPQVTDIHYRSIEGEGMFNWRTIHQVELPQPEALCNLKLQIWNINWSPDDCIAEAIIPLWGFFERARREAERIQKEEKYDQRSLIATVEKQKVYLTHPQNSDSGIVELSMELVPKSVAKNEHFRAAAGFAAFEHGEQAEDYVLPRPNRPPSSFPWWRLDLQCLWRVKFCCKRSKWYIIGTALILIAVIVLYIVISHYMNS